MIVLSWRLQCEINEIKRFDENEIEKNLMRWFIMKLVLRAGRCLVNIVGLVVHQVRQVSNIDKILSKRCLVDFCNHNLSFDFWSNLQSYFSTLLFFFAFFEFQHDFSHSNFIFHSSYDLSWHKESYFTLSYYI